MKKLIALLLIAIFLSSNVSFAQETCNDNTTTCEEGTKCNCGKITENIGGKPMTFWQCRECIPDPTAAANEAANAAATAAQNATNNNQTPAESVMGITCTEDMLVQGQCKLSIYDTLGIRKSIRGKDEATSVGLFVQDIILSATFFIGTVVTIALIISGLMYIFAAASGKDPANAKKGIIGSLIGLLLVVSSYVIIRLIQYLAKGF